MKTVSLSGSPRENVGKKDAKHLRVNGLIPCVMYGGEKQVHFTVNAKEFAPLIFTPYANIIELEIEGKKHRAILKDVQYHPVTDVALHVDFFEINETRPVVIELPIRTIGTSPGVLLGGKLVKKYRKLKVKGLVKDMPEVIEISIDSLNVLDEIRVGELKHDNLQFMNVANSVVVTVKTTRAMAEAAKK